MEQVLTEHLCHECGVLFGLSEHFEGARRADSRVFYCPNGHTLIFNNGKKVPELQKEVETLTQENSELKKTNIALQSRIDQLEAKIAGA